MKSSQGTVFTLTRIYSERELEEEECLKVTIKKGKMKIGKQAIQRSRKVGSRPGSQQLWIPEGEVSQCGSVQFCRSVVSDSLQPHECSTPGLPVHHQLPEFTQTHVHRVGDAIQPSQPLLSSSPLAFNLPQYQGLFKRVSSPHVCEE